jgi:integrase
MAQDRIPRGNHRAIVVRQQPDGRWLARTQVRDLDGRIRSIRVTERTKGAASRKLERRLGDRADPSIVGVTPEMTFETLALLWLQFRRDHGKVHAKGKLAPQTLAIYASEIQNVIIPAIGLVRVREANVPFLDRLFADVEHGRKHGAYATRPNGRSTRQLRVVLNGMLSLAVSHGALAGNPMRDAARSSREARSEVEFLTVEQATHLRQRVRRESVRISGKRMPNRDLEEFIDLLLGTGCREGEGLAIRAVDLIDLHGDVPMLAVCGTLIEPRKGYVEKLHRQDTTKTREDRTLILPRHVAAMLQDRIERNPPRTNQSPIFASRTGNWLSPANMRTRLRKALERVVANGTELDLAVEGTTLHTLRRTVGTLLAHEVSLDAAREQLGHRDPSVTYQHYVGKRSVAPDVRPTLDLLLAPLPLVGGGDVPPAPQANAAPASPHNSPDPGLMLVRQAMDPAWTSHHHPGPAPPPADILKPLPR